MTQLSVNINKIALLRNARGRDFPNVVDFASKFIDQGARGITVHPRQDERHITREDTLRLGEFLSEKDDIEFNIEGYPSEQFLLLVEKVRPEQCTLVPDGPDQLTSDHGWDLFKKSGFIKEICQRLSEAGIRSSLFLDPDCKQVQQAAETGTDRIELYTEEYASSYLSAESRQVFEKYQQAAFEANRLGLGVNAGHDLDLDNLANFLTIPDILEVSIGQALVVECIEHGMETVLKRYLSICRGVTV